MYKHTTPTNGVYIGITCQDPEKRGKHGSGYRQSTYFYNAILKYGWDNISHEILYKDLTETGINNSAIALVCKGKRNKAGGFKGKFKYPQNE